MRPPDSDDRPQIQPDPLHASPPVPRHHARSGANVRSNPWRIPLERRPRDRTPNLSSQDSHVRGSSSGNSRTGIHRTGIVTRAPRANACLSNSSSGPARTINWRMPPRCKGRAQSAERGSILRCGSRADVSKTAAWRSPKRRRPATRLPCSILAVPRLVVRYFPSSSYSSFVFSSSVFHADTGSREPYIGLSSPEDASHFMRHLHRARGSIGGGEPPAPLSSHPQGNRFPSRATHRFSHAPTLTSRKYRNKSVLVFHIPTALVDVPLERGDHLRRIRPAYP